MNDNLYLHIYLFQLYQVQTFEEVKLITSISKRQPGVKSTNERSRFSPSGPGFESLIGQDFFGSAEICSLLLSSWTVDKSNPSSAYM